MAKEFIREFNLKDIVNLRNPKVVVIGGGTGLSSILRGLKNYTNNLTAIVTVGDDGGSSGRLREDLGVLPPGDIRNCILALAKDENLLTKLFDYRFSQGELSGHSFGNLFLAAMDGISHNFYQAISRTSAILHIKGEVIPVTLNSMTLCANLANGMVVEGESNIPQVVMDEATEINELFLKETDIEAFHYAIRAIQRANLIILGPGSLYTSIICNLLVPGIAESINESDAKTYWVSNLMTQPGETKGYTQEDHYNALIKYLGNKDRIDTIIQHNGTVDEEVRNTYLSAGQKIIEPIKNLPGTEVITDNVLTVNDGKIRHNADRIAEIIFENYIK